MTSSRLTIAETAQHFRVHVATVWRWIGHGVRGRKLRSVRIGGRRYVLESDLEAFLACPSASPASPPSAKQAESAGRKLDEVLG